MEVRLYETTFVIDTQLDQKRTDEIVHKIETIIIDAKGEIVRKEIWGKRRLAYKINHKQYGFYVHLLFKAAGEVIQKLERELKLNENVLRFLTVRLSKAALREMEKKMTPPEQKDSTAVKVSSETEPEVEKAVDEQPVE